MKEKKNLNLRWGYTWTYNDGGTMNSYIGLIIGIILLIIITLVSLNVIKLWSWEVGFIDPSTAFAESLIRLYNFIWSFLVLILTVVLILLTRIIYLFNWNLKLFSNLFFNKLMYYIISILLNFSLIVNDANLIEKYTLRLNQLENGSIDLNIWYNDYKKHEFLIISDLHEYKKLEFIWCILPTFVLCLIAGPSFSLVFSLDSSVNPEINIKIVGKQWYWVYSFDNIISFDEVEENVNKVDEINSNNVIISNENMTRVKKIIAFNYDSVMINEEDLKEGTHRLLEVNNRLLVPLGVPVRFLITSTDVLHSWSLPALGLKVDAVPGRLNQFIVEIKRPGIFYGQCSELCGPMHGFMPIIVHAVPFNEYKEWLKTI